MTGIAAMPIESGGPVTALTDAQVAALREAAEKATPGPWRAENRHSDFGPCYNTVRHATGWITDQDGIDKLADARYIAAASPDVVLALLVERDALKAKVAFLKVELSQLANFNPDWDMLQATRESLQDHQRMVRDQMLRADNAESEVAALRARETGLREAMHAIYKGLSSEKDGEFWTAQKWCDDHSIYVDNLQGLRVLEEIARAVLSEDAK